MDFRILDVFLTLPKSSPKTRSESEKELFLVDEADKPSAECPLRQFVKLFGKRLNKGGCQNSSIVQPHPPCRTCAICSPTLPTVSGKKLPPVGFSYSL